MAQSTPSADITVSIVVVDVVVVDVVVDSVDSDTITEVVAPAFLVILVSIHSICDHSGNSVSYSQPMPWEARRENSQISSIKPKGISILVQLIDKTSIVVTSASHSPPLAHNMLY